MLDDLKKEIEQEVDKKSEEDKQDIAEQELQFNTVEIYTRDQMLKLLEKKSAALGKNSDDKLNVGTVGYPNVGKSSLINVLCGKKRVGVAAMPGKTKHF